MTGSNDNSGIDFKEFMALYIWLENWFENWGFEAFRILLALLFFQVKPPELHKVLLNTTAPARSLTWECVLYQPVRIYLRVNRKKSQPKTTLKIFAVDESIIGMDFKRFCPTAVTKERSLVNLWAREGRNYYLIYVYHRVSRELILYWHTTVWKHSLE